MPMQGFSRTTITDDSDSRDAFVYFSDNKIRVVNGSDDDIRRARAQRDGTSESVWYSDGKQAWVLKDPVYLKRIHAAFDREMKVVDIPPSDPGKLAELDRRQMVLNQKMNRLAAQQADLAIKESDPTRPRDAAAYAAGHAALGKEQAAVAQEMAEIGRVRAEQGRERAELGRRQAEASRKAAQEVSGIVAEAIRNHAAQAAR